MSAFYVSFTHFVSYTQIRLGLHYVHAAKSKLTLREQFVWPVVCRLVYRRTVISNVQEREERGCGWRRIQRNVCTYFQRTDQRQVRVPGHC